MTSSNNKGKWEEKAMRTVDAWYDFRHFDQALMSVNFHSGMHILNTVMSNEVLILAVLIGS